MSFRTPFVPNEWYHCYNRGVEKRKIFLDSNDYERFIALLYICNGSKSVHISNFKDHSLEALLSLENIQRGERLVEIGGYCLMKNHFHIVLKEVKKGGISLFMQKIITGYTMYFNKKQERTGPLFSGVFKSKHLANDNYFKRAVAYVHLNPVELFEADWKLGKGNISHIEKFLTTFSYSSLVDFSGKKRLENKLIGSSIFELFDAPPSVASMLKDAQEYYASIFKPNDIKVKP